MIHFDNITPVIKREAYQNNWLHTHDPSKKVDPYKGIKKGIATVFVALITFALIAGI